MDWQFLVTRVFDPVYHSWNLDAWWIILIARIYCPHATRLELLAEHHFAEVSMPYRVNVDFCDCGSRYTWMDLVEVKGYETEKYPRLDGVNISLSISMPYWLYISLNCCHSLPLILIHSNFISCFLKQTTIHCICPASMINTYSWGLFTDYKDLHLLVSYDAYKLAIDSLALDLSLDSVCRNIIFSQGLNTAKYLVRAWCSSSWFGRRSG